VCEKCKFFERKTSSLKRQMFFFLFPQESKSDSREVVLTGLKLTSAGVYTCEASSEAPRFKTVSGAGRLRVIDRPDTKPQITSNKHPGKGYR